MIDKHDESGLAPVGSPLELVRKLEAGYVDQATYHFESYISETLAASQRVGGRFNPQHEFGAIYTASDLDTAWAELAARMARQGVTSLPPEMGMLTLVVSNGIYADLSDDQGRKAWEISARDLTAETPTDDQREACLQLSRSVRAVADFLVSPSARGAGSNVPLFPDRTGGELRMAIAGIRRMKPQRHLMRPSAEPWQASRALAPYAAMRRPVVCVRRPATHSQRSACVQYSPCRSCVTPPRTVC